MSAELGRAVLLGVCMLSIAVAGPSWVQLAAVSPAVPGAPADVSSFEDTYRELMGLKPVPNRVADMRDRVIQRDVATFTL
jgi:hypothetical protein